MVVSAILAGAVAVQALRGLHGVVLVVAGGFGLVIIDIKNGIISILMMDVFYLMLLL